MSESGEGQKKFEDCPHAPTDWAYTPDRTSGNVPGMGGKVTVKKWTCKCGKVSYDRPPGFGEPPKS